MLVRFHVNYPFGDNDDEIVELPDGLIDEEIERECSEWVFNMLDSWWEKVEDEGDK
jgi:hypothetical protein